MGEMFKSTYTIDDMLDRMGVKIVLDGSQMSEEDKEEAERNGDIVENDLDEKEE